VAAVDPAGIGGVVVRARAGPVRERWLAALTRARGTATPVHRMPAHIEDDRLLGGLDLSATLHAGMPVAARGLLAEADGGLLQIAMAERLTAATASRIVAAMDTGEVVLARDGLSLRHPTRFGVIALDEGLEPGEQPPAALMDRLAIHLDLTPLSHRDCDGQGPSARAVELARQRLAHLAVADDMVEGLVHAAAAFGVDSLRAPLLALRVACANAALSGRDSVTDVDARVAGQLVLAPRATKLPPVEAPPESESDESPPPEEPEPPRDTPEPDSPEADSGDDDEAQADPDAAMAEVVLAAIQAALTPGQLAALQGAGGTGGSAGRAGAVQTSKTRGRRVGVRQGRPTSGARLDVVETLRAAAPWQRLRGRAPADANGQRGRLQVRADDFRVVRTKHKTETTTIFAVDASGSSALHRLAECKGAVELLLADCYVRRDKVALIAFRGQAAELLLPPTRSLTRAKRSLASLPGGGGTPVAAGLDAALELTEAALRRGESPTVVLLTDGRANVARDGHGNRDQAREDAQNAARRLRAHGVAALLIDSSPRPRPAARELAAHMGARYLPLPQANAQTVSQAVRDAQGAGSRAA
jgi:magnesium chelatase subunit D